MALPKNHARLYKMYLDAPIRVNSGDGLVPFVAALVCSQINFYDKDQKLGCFVQNASIERSKLLFRY